MQLRAIHHLVKQFRKHLYISFAVLLSISLLPTSSFASSSDLDSFWVKIAEEDLRKSFALFENCQSPALLKIERISSLPLVQGNKLQTVEKWTLTSCNRERSWQVIFNPDPSTGMSYKQWPSSNK